MTESEWLVATEPLPMLESLQGKSSDRKLRLFATACCRRIWHLLEDGRSRKTVEIAEQYAEGLVDRKQLVQARDEARDAKRQFSPYTQVVALRAAGAVQDATRDTAKSAAWNTLFETSRAVNSHDTNHCDETELKHQTNLVRDIFGNPFRPVTINPIWLTPNVVALAQTIYDDRAFDRLPELADALVNAGCDNEDILGHCRSEGPHVRGCWVVDLVLGKE